MALDPRRLLTPAAARQLREALWRRPSVEVCGVGLGRQARIDDVLLFENVHPTPGVAFTASAPSILRALRAADGRRAKVRCVFHSHPSGSLELSAADQRGALLGGTPAFPSAALWLLTPLGGGGARVLVSEWSLEDLSYQRVGEFELHAPAPRAPAPQLCAEISREPMCAGLPPAPHMTPAALECR